MAQGHHPQCLTNDPDAVWHEPFCNCDALEAIDIAKQLQKFLNDHAVQDRTTNQEEE